MRLDSPGIGSHRILRSWRPKPMEFHSNQWMQRRKNKKCIWSIVFEFHRRTVYKIYYYNLLHYLIFSPARLGRPRANTPARAPIRPRTITPARLTIHLLVCSPFCLPCIKLINFPRSCAASHTPMHAFPSMLLLPPTQPSSRSLFRVDASSFLQCKGPRMSACTC